MLVNVSIKVLECNKHHFYVFRYKLGAREQFENAVLCSFESKLARCDLFGG